MSERRTFGNNKWMTDNEKMDPIFNVILKLILEIHAELVDNPFRPKGHTQIAREARIEMVKALNPFFNEVEEMIKHLDHELRTRYLLPEAYRDTIGVRVENEIRSMRDVVDPEHPHLPAPVVNQSQCDAHSTTSPDPKYDKVDGWILEDTKFPRNPPFQVVTNRELVNYMLRRGWILLGTYTKART